MGLIECVGGAASTAAGSMTALVMAMPIARTARVLMAMSDPPFPRGGWIDIRSIITRTRDGQPRNRRIMRTPTAEGNVGCATRAVRLEVVFRLRRVAGVDGRAVGPASSAT